MTETFDNNIDRTVALNYGREISIQTEQEINFREKAEELGLPLAQVRALDNRNLRPQVSAEDVHPAVTDLIAQDPQSYALFGNQFPNFNKVAQELQSMSPEDISFRLKRRLAEQDAELKKLSPKAAKVSKESVENIEQTRKDLAVIQLMNRNFSDWGTTHTAQLQRYIETLKEYNVDLESIGYGVDDLKRLQKRSLSDYDSKDAMGALDLFGIMSAEKALKKRYYAPDAAQIEAINKGNYDLVSPQALAWYSEHLNDMVRDSRGETTNLQIAQTLTHMVPFALELMGTGGVSNILRSGGFTGFGAGARAFFTSQGQKALRDAAGAILTQEAKRLPFYLPAEVLSAYADTDTEVRLASGTDNEMTVKAHQVDMFTDKVLNAMLSRFTENTSERIGAFIPEVPLSGLGKFIPRRFKNMLAFGLLDDLAVDPVKGAALRRFLSDSVPTLDGVLGEVIEEKAAGFANYAYTLLSDATGVKFLDMGQRSAWGTAEENEVIFGTTAITGALFGAVGFSTRYKGVQRFLSNYASEQRIVDELSQTTLAQKSSTQTRYILDKLRGGDVRHQVTPDGAAAVLESAPEFAEKLGITADAIEKARKDGGSVEVSGNNLTALQAHNPEFRSAGEELWKNVIDTTTGQTLGTIDEKALEAENKEAAERFRKLAKKYNFKFQYAAREAALKAKLPAGAVTNFAKEMGYILSTIATHSDEAAVDEMVDKLAFEFVNDPESFSDAVRNQVYPVYTGSAADYDQPSLQYVGTGEGAQAYGWGLYGSSSYGVGKGYAVADVDRKLSNLQGLYHGDKHLTSIYNEGITPVEKEVYLAAVQAMYNSGAAATMGEVRKYLTQRLNDKLKEREEFWGDVEWLADHINALTEALDTLTEYHLPEFKNPKGRRNLYVQTFWADRQENLLEWGERVPANQKALILKQLDTELDESTLIEENQYEAEKRLVHGLTEYDNYIGSSLYHDLSDMLGSPKAASEFLYRAGIDGITYIGGSSGVRNYVAFSDKDIRVDEHIRFQGKKNATDGLLTSFRNLIRGSRSANAGTAVHQSLLHNISQLPDNVKDAFEDFYKRILKARPPEGMMEPISPENFVYSLRSIGFKNSKERVGKKGTESVYLTINGHTVRVSGHNTTASLFLENNEADNDIIAIVIEKDKPPKRKGDKTNKRRKPFLPDANVDMIEYVFKARELTQEKLAVIFHDITEFLATGEYTDRAGANVPHYSGSEEFKAQAKQKIEGDASAIKTADLLLQQSSDPQHVRGAIRWDDANRAIITLFNTSDASTIPHESAHWLLRMLEDFDKRGILDESLKADFAAINEWLDTRKYKSAVGTPEHNEERDEYFARAFEAYCIVGSVPNGQLTSAFGMAKRMLVGVYKNMGYADFDDESLAYAIAKTDISPEVRRVFSSWLATESVAEEMALMNEVFEEIYKHLTGLAEDGKFDFRKLGEKAFFQTVAAADKHKAALLKDLTKVWKREAKAEMDMAPVYLAWAAIRKAGGLDYATVKSLLGAKATAVLRKRGLLSKRNATGASIVDFAGEYSSPEAMLRELGECRTPTEFVEDYLTAQTAAFDEEYRLGDSAAAVDANLEALSNLVDFLSQKTGDNSYSAKRKALKIQAEREIEGMTVRDVIDSKATLGNCKKLAADLTKALRKDDYNTGLQVAANLRYQLEMLRFKAKSSELVNSTVRLERRALGADDGSIYGEYHNALREIGVFFGFTSREPKYSGAHQNNSRRTISGATEEDTAIGFTPTVWSDFIYSERATDYRDLTFADFRELRDFIRYAYGMGRDEVKANKESLAASVAANVGEALNSMEGLPARYSEADGRSTQDVAWDKIHSFINQGIKLRYHLRRIDGFADDGIGIRIYDRLAAVESEKAQLYTDFIFPVNEIRKQLDAQLKDIDLSGLPQFKDAGATHGYVEWTPAMVTACCLNMGNIQNREQLKAGYGWDDADLAAIAGKLSTDQWKMIQKLWDFISGSTLAKRIQEEFLKENHYELRLVQPDAFEVTTSDGTLALDGGYYPIVYKYLPKVKGDPATFDAHRIYQEASSTRERVAGIKADGLLRLSLDCIDRWAAEGSHYAASRNTMRELYRTVSNSRFENMYGSRFGFRNYKAMLDGIKKIANPAEIRDWMDRMLSYARKIAVASSLAFNTRSVAMQPASITVGVDEVGADYLFDAVSEMTTDYLKLRDFIFERSATMRNRTRMYEGETARFKEGKSSGAKVMESLENAAYFAMKLTDAHVAFVAWRAAYNRKMADLTDVSYMEADKKAAIYADDFVSRTQGGTRTLDLTPVQYTGIGRAFAPFLTAVNAQFNTILERHQVWRNGHITDAEYFGAICGNILAPALYGGVIAALYAATTTEGDEEDKWQEAHNAFLRELMVSTFSGIPWAREVADFAGTAAAAKITGGRGNYSSDVYNPAVFRVLNGIVNDAVRGADLLSEAVLEKDLHDFGRAGYFFTKAVSTAAGVPAIHVYERTQKLTKGAGLDWLPDVRKSNKGRKK